MHQVNLFDYAWAMLLSCDRQSNKPDFRLQAEFKSTFGRPIRIGFLACSIPSSPFGGSAIR